MIGGAAEPRPTGEGSKILWADVREMLGVTVSELRSLRGAFGDLLGLDVGRTVSKEMVPVLAHLERLRREGVPDDEIRQRIISLSSEPGWPEEVMTRMEAASTASGAAFEAAYLTQIASVSPDIAPGEPPGESQAPEVVSGDTLDKVREMVLDLRREIAMNTHSDREIMLQLTQCVRKLALEVRDLRYAFLLASSRKDRKKGIKTLSRLLSN
jgi:hypothetical protein